MFTPRAKTQLTAHHLKRIAMSSMLIDHIGAIIIYKLMLTPNTPANHLQELYTITRTVGRLAFPLYCFLLVEGFRHTRSKPKYMMRLLLFAVISEIPYDLAFSEVLINPTRNNVFLTLLLGFLMMWTIDACEEKTSKQDQLIDIVTKGIVRTLTCCFYMLLASRFHTDYGHTGVLTIWILFTLRGRPTLATFLATLSMSMTTSSPIQLASLLCVIPIACYNGQKGTSGNRYLFYIFYPAHLLILIAVAQLIQVT